jgi:hypothetical protein
MTLLDLLQRAGIRRFSAKGMEGNLSLVEHHEDRVGINAPESLPILETTKWGEHVREQPSLRTSSNNTPIAGPASPS